MTRSSASNPWSVSGLISPELRRMWRSTAITSSRRSPVSGMAVGHGDHAVSIRRQGKVGTVGHLRYRTALLVPARAATASMVSFV